MCCAVTLRQVAASKRVELTDAAATHRAGLVLRASMKARSSTKGPVEYATSAGYTIEQVLRDIGGEEVPALLYVAITGESSLDHENRVEWAWNRAVLLAAGVFFAMTNRATAKQVAISMYLRAYKAPMMATNLLASAGNAISHRLAREIENGLARRKELDVWTTLAELYRMYGDDLGVAFSSDNCDYLLSGTMDGRQISWINVEVRCWRRSGEPIDVTVLGPSIQTVRTTLSHCAARA